MQQVLDSEKELYFVALKLFLERDGELLILKDRFGDWDLPGGRITRKEFHTPLADILKRKLVEEIGTDVVYDVAERPAVLMRHERVEAVEGSPTVRIFAAGYRAEYLRGQIHLSTQHVRIEWVPWRTFEPEGYFTGGWLAGVQEYLWRRRSEISA